ncbi:hypothetical protein LCGC14_0305880 [marine sediment metagenome]|uniref:Uncharacterized protein n=1 Tax=marine sediment metagenome TaxID=412755 RepID=A0A0F9TTX3_9ZZZZ
MPDSYSEVAKIMHLDSNQVGKIFDYIYSLGSIPSFVVYNSLTTARTNGVDWTPQEVRFAFFIWGVNFGYETRRVEADE